MKTAGSLAARSKTDLAAMAQRRGIRGWAAMDKSALVKALSKSPAKAPAASTPKKTKPTKPAAKSAPRITRPAKTKPAAKPAPKPAPIAAKLAPAAPKSAAAKPVAPIPVAKPAVPVTPKLPMPVAVPKPTANGTHKSVAVAPVSAAKPGTKLPPKLIPKAPAVPAKPSATRPLVQKPVQDAPVRVSAPIPKDRIILAVSNPHWLHAYWELSQNSVQRAEAALKQDWHGAKLIIRLFDVTSLDTTSTSETPVRDIVVQNTGRTWYIDVPQPPRTYRADIGYVSRRGEFHVLARSNVVTPPKTGSGEPGDALDGDWDDGDAKHRAERMLAMSTGFESPGNAELRELLEERVGRPLGPPKETAFGTGATPPNSVKKFFFEIDAKLIVFGRTDPSAHLTLNNDPIKLNTDGSFRMTFNLPDSRQIIPAVAASSDGVEERTIILAVERNTKHLDPMIHDQMNEM